MYPNDFNLVPEELFRLGNTSSPKLSHVRARDKPTPYDRLGMAFSAKH